MKYTRFFILIVILSLSILTAPHSLYAAENPLSVSNNKYGIHILFPEEVVLAAKLVNSNGGDWGYVVVPIQTSDKNIPRWQKFMDDCKKLHVIPIMRLATDGDYFNTSSWRKPTEFDVIDFANFLNSLVWPTKNKYIVVFNEPNRGDEWGGVPNPDEYAKLLSYTVSVFKSRNPDFFIVSAGLDNAAANTGIAMDEFSYLHAMQQTVPGIFYQIDGIASHSYPNPAFAQPPSKQDGESINSFMYEKNYIKTLGSNDLPIFITETGWTKKAVAEPIIASYYTQAFSSTWQSKDIVTVAPFILKATGPFEQFSLLDPSNNGNAIYNAIFALSKVKGTPAILSSHVLGVETVYNTNLPVKDYRQVTMTPHSPLLRERILDVLHWIFKI